jgi:starch synthase
MDKRKDHILPSYDHGHCGCFCCGLKSGFSENFKQCVEFRDAKTDLLEKYNDQFDFEELSKLAIDYSDGVIVAKKNVNKDLIKYAKSNQVPLLAYPGEDFADAYDKFYEKI